MSSLNNDSSPRLNDLLDMRGKHCLVVGGAGYLGREMTAVLAELGANVFVASRDEAQCRKVAAELQDRGSVEALSSLDVTEQSSIDACLEDVRSRGPLDVLVNCAWSGRKNSLDSISVEDWKLDLDVCLTGVFTMTKSALPDLRASRGAVLNVASMYGSVAPDFGIYAANTGLANPPSYGAAKAGVIQLTRYLATALSGDGVRVNCVSPGPFPFPSTAADHPAFQMALEGKVPLGRTGRPHELKGVTALLCSQAGSYITGQNIAVDGGWTTW